MTTNATNLDDAQAAGTDAAPAPRPALSRTLLITGAVLGVLILVGLGAVLGRIISPSSPSGPQPKSASSESQGTEAATIPFGTHLSLPDGAAVRTMSLSGQQLAVHYDSPDGGGIVIINLATGRTIARLRTEPGVR